MSGHHRLVLGCIAAIGLTLGALTGCATDHKPVAGQDAGDDAAFGLAFNENPDEGAKLTFGRPDSDDLKLMLECKPGSGRVEIFQFSGPERSGPMNLASGARTTRLAALGLCHSGGRPDRRVRLGRVSRNGAAVRLWPGLSL